MDSSNIPEKFHMSNQDLPQRTTETQDMSPKIEFSWKLCKSRRYIVTAMSLLGFFNAYTINVSFNVAIVAMTQKVNVILENGTTVETQEFDWNSKEQGLVLSSVYYGYMCTQILGGILAERFSGHIVFGIDVGASAILMILSPMAAKQGIMPLIVTRILIGLLHGVTYPSIQDVYAHWAPIYERTTITGIVHSGSAIGISAAFLLSGLFVEYLSWESIFYVFGGLGCIWYIIWMIFIKKDPASDPRISPEERAYIENNREKIDEKKNIQRPWKDIFTSSAVIAVTIVNFCDIWTTSMFVTEAPTFLKDVLNFDFKQMGITAAAPYLMYIVIAFIVSPLSDYLRSRKILTTQQVRKIFVSSGFLGTAFFLLIMCNMDSAAAVSSCLIIAVGITAITRTSYYSNALDFAPNYASVIMGISITIGTITAIVSPSVVGFIVQNGLKDEWKIVFYITAGFCVCGSIVFGIFGKGTVQSWAQSSEVHKHRIDRASD